MPDSCNGFVAQFCKNINNINTEFVFHTFANRWFLLVTQYNGIPNLYTVKFDLQHRHGVSSAMNEPIDHPQYHRSVPITIMNNFGANESKITSSIQFLIDKSRLKACPTELTVGLGLKEYNGATLKEIVKILDEIVK